MLHSTEPSTCAEISGGMLQSGSCKMLQSLRSFVACHVTLSACVVYVVLQ